MKRSRSLYAIFWIIAVAAAGYYAYTFLSPLEMPGSANAAVPTANVGFVGGKDFSGMDQTVNLPLPTGAPGWPTPFQSIYERGLPGVYANANGNANRNASY